MNAGMIGEGVIVSLIEDDETILTDYMTNVRSMYAGIQELQKDKKVLRIIRVESGEASRTWSLDIATRVSLWKRGRKPGLIGHGSLRDEVCFVATGQDFLFRRSRPSVCFFSLMIGYDLRDGSRSFKAAIIVFGVHWR